MRRKKLHLHRETLRTLDRVHLSRAIGGGDTHEIQTGCACTDTCCCTDGCGTGGTGGSADCTNDTCTCIMPASYCVC